MRASFFAQILAIFIFLVDQTLFCIDHEFLYVNDYYYHSTKRNKSILFKFLFIYLLCLALKRENDTNDPCSCLSENTKKKNLFVFLRGGNQSHPARRLAKSDQRTTRHAAFSPGH